MSVRDVREVAADMLEEAGDVVGAAVLRHLDEVVGGVVVRTAEAAAKLWFVCRFRDELADIDRGPPRDPEEPVLARGDHPAHMPAWLEPLEVDPFLATFAAMDSWSEGPEGDE